MVEQAQDIISRTVTLKVRWTAYISNGIREETEQYLPDRQAHNEDSPSSAV